MVFDYSKLKGRIVEIFGSQKEFAKAMHISERTLSLKMNNDRPWKQMDITNALFLLKLPDESIQEYFFTTKVQKIEQKGEGLN